MTVTLRDRPPIPDLDAVRDIEDELETQFNLAAPTRALRQGETAPIRAGGGQAGENTKVWRTQAACREVDNAADLFFSEELHEIAAAKRICAECPVIASCLEGAIGRREPWGVWGGQIFLNGRILAKKRRRGRPPKNPRPEDLMPEVPVPEHLVKLIA